MASDGTAALAPAAIAALAVTLAVAALPARADGFPVGQVIEAIKSEMNLARLASAPEDRRLKITSVEITLTAVARSEGESGVKLEVPVIEELAGGIDAHAGVTLANTQRIVLTLTPLGAPELVSGTAGLGLASAIESVKGALREAARGPFSFGLDRFVFEAEFAVTKSAGGGVRFLFVDVAKVAREAVAVHHAAIHMELAD